MALNDVFDTGLATILDAFGTANELASMSGLDSLHFEVTVVGTRRKVITSQGLRVPVVPVTVHPAPELVIVPALGFKMPETLQPALARPEVNEAVQALRTWAVNGAVVAAACIGTFVLAESALLDDQEATTTWWLAPLFRQRYPKVRLDESRIIVSSNQVVTAGAALSHLDMVLWLIRRASPELAALTAKYLLIDARPSQAAYMIPSHLAHADPIVESFERWARRRLAKGFSLKAAARATATSTRTLAGECTRCWENHRSLIFRICALSAPYTC